MQTDVWMAGLKGVTEVFGEAHLYLLAEYHFASRLIAHFSPRPLESTNLGQNSLSPSHHSKPRITPYSMITSNRSCMAGEWSHRWAHFVVTYIASVHLDDILLVCKCRHIHPHAVWELQCLQPPFFLLPLTEWQSPHHRNIPSPVSFKKHVLIQLWEIAEMLDNAQ